MKKREDNKRVSRLRMLAINIGLLVCVTIFCFMTMGMNGGCAQYGGSYTDAEFLYDIEGASNYMKDPNNSADTADLVLTSGFVGDINFTMSIETLRDGTTLEDMFTFADSISFELDLPDNLVGKISVSGNDDISITPVEYADVTKLTLSGTSLTISELISDGEYEFELVFVGLQYIGGGETYDESPYVTITMVVGAAANIERNGQTVGYTTLEDAIADVQDGETIVLLRNVEAEEAIDINRETDFTLDLNGKEISSDALQTLCIKSGMVAVKNGTIRNTRVSGTGILIDNADAKAELSALTVTANGDGSSAVVTYVDVRIYSGTYTGDTNAVAIKNNGALTVHAGGFAATGETSSPAIYTEESGTAELANGSYIVSAKPESSNWLNESREVTIAVRPPIIISNCTITFETNGGSTVEKQLVIIGGVANKPADPTRDGYEFTAWYTDKDCTEEYDFSARVTTSFALYAGWEEAGEWENPFSDVKSNDWFVNDVEYVVRNGIFRGISETKFNPESPMTRGMLIAALGRIAGIDTESAEYELTFTDVDTDAYYAPYIAWAAENGIVLGVGDNRFKPDAEISRQDFCVILTRYIQFAGVELITTSEYRIFADEDEIASYAKNAIQLMNKLGVILGRGGNVIDPESATTRAEAAAMLHRFIERIK